MEDGKKMVRLSLARLLNSLIYCAVTLWLKDFRAPVFLIASQILRLPAEAATACDWELELDGECGIDSTFGGVPVKGGKMSCVRSGYREIKKRPVKVAFLFLLME